MRMNDKVRKPFNSVNQTRPGCQHLLGCKCERPYWLLDAGDPKLAIAEAEHRRRMGMPLENERE